MSRENNLGTKKMTYFLGKIFFTSFFRNTIWNINRFKGILMYRAVRKQVNHDILSKLMLTYLESWCHLSFSLHEETFPLLIQTAPESIWLRIMLDIFPPNITSALREKKHSSKTLHYEKLFSDIFIWSIDLTRLGSQIFIPKLKSGATKQNSSKAKIR